MRPQTKRNNVEGCSWFVLLFLCALLAGLPSASAEADERPNVLLILVDDLKPALGCYGDAMAITPNIDRLAASGMRFDLAYCNQAVCAPSRFTLMLGSHSTSTGLYGLGSPLRQIVPDAVTMPQYFAKHGYRTESLGKIFHIGHGNHGDPESFSVPHFKEKVIEYADPASSPGGKLTREEAMFQNVKAPPGGMNTLPRGAAFEHPDVADDAYADGRVAVETIHRLRAAKERKGPFFIAAGFARPHLPFSAPKKYWDLYDADAFKLASNPELPAGSPKVAQKRGGEIRNYFPVPDKNDPAAIDNSIARKLIHGYYASTSYVDAQIGKVLDELKSSGQADNTIVVLWGDHGFHLGDLGIWTKHTNYEQANRIPILISAPGVTKPGSSTKQLAESVDIFPTLAELAGLEAPQGPQPIDGVSLVPVLKSSAARVRDHAYHAYPKQKLGRAIRTERYRMVEWRGFGAAKESAEYELYDYQTDPMEMKNLAAEQPEVVEKLKSVLAKYPAPVGRSGKKKAREKEGSNKKAAIVQPKTSPQIARRPLTITGRVSSVQSTGVIVAHGGREHGYAVHMLNGRLAFDVRVNGKVKRIQSREPFAEVFNFKATLSGKKMTLAAGGKDLAEGRSPGLIPVQPKDGLNFGFDDLSAAGDYDAPNKFAGRIENIKVTTDQRLFVEKPNMEQRSSPLRNARNENGRGRENDSQEASPMAADQFPKSAFVEVPTDRKPGPVMDAETIQAGLKSHDRALYIKAGWIRDPYITTGPDDYFYLTGTQPREGDPREAKNPYNIGLGDESIVGHQVRLWRSKDLIQWESLGPIFTVDDTMKAKRSNKAVVRRIWAPEVHWLADKNRWALVHCPKQHSSLALTNGADLQGPWTHPMDGAMGADEMGQRHDPSIFTDEDGKRFLLWGNTLVAPLSDDLTNYTADPVRIDPAGSRPGPNGEPISRIGHEGATMIKVGGKYVHLGTAWSTDQGRKGSYNLYYSVADKITGPYGPRKFAGRFLGHGTPFKDKAGKWWCTAFFNANVPPESRDGIENRDLGDNARTLNEQGVTIVPLDVCILDNGEICVRAKDPAYASPGPDEAQKF